MDVHDLPSGSFDQKLLLEIGSASDFILILSAGSMDRCINEDDWLRWEIAHALKSGKNIVPVKARGFEWPPLPEELKELPYLQAVETSHELFEESMEKLAKLLKARPSPPARRLKLLFASAVALLLGIVTWVVIPHTDRQFGDNYNLGRELCFYQDQWKQGVTMLAQKGGWFQEAAAAELQFPEKSNELQLARLWLAAGNRVGQPDKWHCYRRARYWYLAALDGPDAKADAQLAESIKSELAHVPLLPAKVIFKGQSNARETIAVGPGAIRWRSERGGGPFEIVGLENPLQPFRVRPGEQGARNFVSTNVIPDGVDFSTARVIRAEFGGKNAARYHFETRRNAANILGFVLQVEEKNPDRHDGGFTFEITVCFGN